jgi:DedD protein
MDPTLKQRLVGTAVLVALAVIFVPMLLDGPVEHEDDDRVTGVPLALPDPVVAEPRDERPPMRQEAPAELQQPAPEPQPAPAEGEWAVQLGAFSERPRADALAATMRDAGFPAFVQRAEMANGVLYRVRIGPFADRDEAEGLLRQVAEASGERAVVVAHP